VLARRDGCCRGERRAGVTRRPHAGAAVAAPDSATVRAQVLRGIARNRTPGLHFPGHFLLLERRHFERDGVRMAMPDGPHCVDATGAVALPALAVLADASLASATRPFLPVGARIATSSIHLNFTGLVPRGPLLGEGQCLGFSEQAVLRQAYGRGLVRSAEGVVCHGSGTFVQLETPPGVKLHPTAWDVRDQPPEPEIDPRRLDAVERRVLLRADACLAATTTGTCFLDRFWGGRIAGAHHAARGTLPLGAHVGNRVGNAQGGILVAFAAAVARAAVPRHGVLESVSAWFISPGIARQLTARAQVLQHGRNLSVVRTQVFAPGRKRVLEVVTNHAVARAPA
jgi:acyl-coenzyme A thioesterase PaaI-like protein